MTDSLFGLPVSATSSSFPAACFALLLLGRVSCQKIWKFAVRRTLGKASSISFDTLLTNPWKHIGCLNPFMHRCNSISFERTAVKICNQWACIRVSRKKLFFKFCLLLLTNGANRWGEPPKFFQNYRPINKNLPAVFSFRGNIAGGIPKNHFRAITFD